MKTNNLTNFVLNQNKIKSLLTPGPASLLPENINFSDAIKIASVNSKMEVLNFSFDLENRYTVWSGILGGTFLMMSYFGTDQSQVQRYLSGKSLKEMQLGMIFNGVFKIPMQFFILFIGVMVFVFYQERNVALVSLFFMPCVCSNFKNI